MKQTMKRLISLILCFVMVMGLMPVFVLNADAAETPLAAAIFASDIHETSTGLTGSGTSAMKSVLSAIGANGVTYDTIGFVGDTFTDIAGAKANMTSAAQTALGQNAEVFYAWGDHDAESDISSESGLLYTGDYHYIYHISDADMRSKAGATASGVESAISAFETAAASMDKSRVLFIMSHVPLHDRRDDNTYANDWYTAIKAVADTMEVVFFWAHNHTSENDVDRAAYYVARDGSEQITIYGGDTVTPNFTYMNAGYIYAAGQNPSRKGVATTVEIYADSLVFQDYSSSGEYTDSSYSHNVTVAREFTDTVDSGETETVTLSSIAISGTTEYTVGDELDLTVTATYSDGSTADVTADATITGYDMSTVGTQTVTATYEDQTATTTITVAEAPTDPTEETTEPTEAPTDPTVPETSEPSETSSVGVEEDVTVLGYDNTVSTTVWKLTDTITAGETYLIVNTNAASTSAHAMGHSGTTPADDAVVVYNDGTNTYILDSDVDSTSKWTFEGSSGSWTPKNGDYYLTYTFTEESEWWGGTSYSNFALAVNTTAYTWATNGSNLYFNKDGNRYGLTYSNGWTLGAATGSWGNYTYPNVYFYTPTTITTGTSVPDTTYHMNLTVDGNAVSNHAYTVTGVTEDTTAQMNAVFTTTADGTTTTLDGYPANGSFTLTSTNEAVATIDDSGVLTFTGEEGETLIQVDYTWTVDGVEYTTRNYVTVTAKAPVYALGIAEDSASVKIGATAQLTAAATADGAVIADAEITWTSSDETIATVDANGVVTGKAAGDVIITATYTDSNGTVHTDTAAVEVVDAVYALDICKKTENADGTATYESITAPIVIKGVTNGMTHSVWAVITADGEDIGALDEAGLEKLTFTSSDESIATVDKTTGTVTFTGKEGTVQITASYEYADGKSVTDTVTFSVTATQYSVPSDGTTDFPEYPNEGAIRYDKTAVAVGNFSETGIAQVELSMTGVPYTTGSEIDVVIMLDMTGSMTTDSISAARASAIAFADQIIKNEDGTYNDNRISVQQFNKDGVTELWELSAVTADTYADLKSAINGSTQAKGGTPYSTALQACYEILYAAKTDGIGNDRQQFCVFVSDGTPTSVTYITNTTTPTTTTTVSFTRNDATYTQTVPAYSTGSTSDTFASSSNSYHEYWSQLMINNSVTVYGVYTSVAAGSSSSSGGSVNDLETGTICMNKVATNADKVYVVSDAEDTSALTGVFTSIALDILQAATDVTVEDKITDEYTMIFDLPEGTKDITGLDSQEFYIEFVKYTLDENNERTNDVTSITKLYLGISNGSYYAASDASGTAYAAPVFEQTTIGEKGSLYYWTTDSTYASKAAVSYSDGSTTYYFVPYGIKATDDGYDSAKWFNMTSGAYAYGTVDSTTNMSEDLVIATPYFVYNASTRMLYWTVDKLDTEEYALRYFLYLDNSATEVGTNKEVDAATYPTNDHAYITYTNFKGNDCRQVFPIPQLTWNGAQVSYVFYLVNAAGQPINKSGQVVDFANAVFVTDVYTKAVVWNKGTEGTTGTGELSADWLANELLPDEYTIYDELAGFELNVYEKADGTTIKNQFTIEGDTAANISASLNSRLDLETTESTVSVATTKVYNTKAGQKVTGYGTYYSTDSDMAGIDFSNTTVAFAVVWESKLVEDVVVVDFGLDVLINVVQNDLLQNTVSGIGLGKDAYGSTAMNTGIVTDSKLGTASLKIDDNTISIENENTVRFHQGDMTFANAVTFYYESPVEYYEGSLKESGYMYSSVTVIPATTIYYEDSFVDLSIWDNQDNELAETWETVGTASGDTQDQDRPGQSQISEDLDADNIYGYDSAYTDCAEYSMGSARKVTVDTTRYAEAQFTFYGTGFDVISLTSNTTGTISVDVYDADEFAASPYGSTVKTAMVDTYYGYTKDGDGNWIVDTTATDSLYQVPVMKIKDLPYDKYTVVITVAYYAGFDHQDAGSLDFYLDAIRIYDPTGNNSTTVNGYYVEDHEGWPVYQELRNNVIDSASAGQIAGAVYIDGAESDVYAVSDYTSFGPNNELYLAPGQAVAFTMDLATVKSELDRLQIAMKSANGEDVSYCIFDANSIKDQGDVATLKTNTIATSTDLYYDITELKESTIVIMNISENDAILSITNLKATFTADPGDLDFSFSKVDEDALNALLTALNTAAPEAGESTESTESTEGTEGGDSGSGSTIGQIIDWLRRLLNLN